MDELEVSRQIENMCRFIKQEAEEKAGEIRVSAEEVRPVCLETGWNLADWHLGLQHSCSSPRPSSWPSFCPSQEFNLEKLQLLEQEKAKIRKDYERREAQVEVKKKM
jgi:V-type H+-transporting ATPase subunit E